MTEEDRASDGATCAGNGQPNSRLIGRAVDTGSWTDPELTTRLGALLLALPSGHSSLFEQQLRTPLTALVTSTALLAEDMSTLSQEQTHERVTALHRRALLLHMVAENLFCATAIGDGRFQLQRQEIGLNEVIAEASAAALTLLRYRRQWLEPSGDDSSALALIDPRRIGQVLLNVIQTTSDEAVEGSALKIETDARELVVRVEVSALHPLASEPISPTPRLPVSPVESSGLGIGVARSIVEAHGGAFGSEDGVRSWFELPRS